MSDFPLSDGEAALLAESTQRAVASEKLMLKAKANALRCICFGSVIAIAGACLGGSLWAYSRILDKTTHVDEIADAISQALAAAKLDLQLSGPVQVGGSVSLSDKQQVSLQGGQSVTLSQQKPIEVSGSVQVNINNPEPRRTTTPKRTVENFVVFKSAPFMDGVVVTGWRFENNKQSAPSSQYCYYSKQEADADAEHIVMLGNDRIQLQPDDDTPIDVGAAFEKCVWFRT